LAIQSIERAAGILRALASGPRRLGVSQLSERLGLAKGTVHGLLRALQAEGFVEQDRETGKYQLGAALLQLGNSYLDLSELRRRSLAWSDGLALKTGEAVRIGVLHGDSVLVVHHVFRPDNTLQILEVGANLPLHATALGKALLAYHPDVFEDLVSEPLPRLTRRTIVDPGRLRMVIAEIVSRGWAAETEEAILGEAGVAAPIFDARGQAAGAIGVTGAMERLTTRRGTPHATAGREVLAAARAISRELGAPRWPATGASGAA
jgi:DNA-binding IclR family transcriptional regulator